MAEEQDNTKQENTKQNFSFAQTGLNMDLTPSQVKPGMLTYALNASLENYDTNSINYQNESGNELCLSFPEGFLLIGTYFISEETRHVFFITNPNITGNKDQIG